MVLRLRKVHDITPIQMNKDDTLTVTCSSDILARTAQKYSVIKGDVPVMRELVNFQGIINVIITADILNGEDHVGIVVFMGTDLTPEMCGITLPCPEGVTFK